MTVEAALELAGMGFGEGSTAIARKFNLMLRLQLTRSPSVAPSEKLTGRGGTNFGPVLAYLEERWDYDGPIVYTDGYAPCPAPQSADSHSAIVCELGALPELLSKSTASGARGLS